MNTLAPWCFEEQRSCFTSLAKQPLPRLCRDCHNADSVTTLTPKLLPDLAPLTYTNLAGNGPADGYPNHDVLVPNNLVNLGDPPHLLSMLLCAGQRTVSGSATYSKVPSANPATDYAFCLSCHDGSANTGHRVNVRQDYIDKGHFFKSAGSFGGTPWNAGDRIPCSDCHASHNSPTNAVLFEPDNATFAGTRPSGLTFASHYSPTPAQYRALCISCHTAYNATNTPDALPTVRGVKPAARLPTAAPDAPASPSPRSKTGLGGRDRSGEN